MTRRTPDDPRPEIRVTDKRHSGRPAAVEPPAGPAAPGRDPAGEPGPEELDAVVAAQAQAAEYLEHLQRLQAEFENYRKRTMKEQTRALELGAEGLVRRLLEVLDEFALALGSADAKPEFAPFHRGFELVHTKLVGALEAEGLAPIDAAGSPFDPEVHEALMSDGGDGEAVVGAVLRPGYTLKGRVIRPAGVRVEHVPSASPDEVAGGPAEEPERG